MTNEDLNRCIDAYANFIGNWYKEISGGLYRPAVRKMTPKQLEWLLVDAVVCTRNRAKLYNLIHSYKMYIILLDRLKGREKNEASEE